MKASFTGYSKRMPKEAQGQVKEKQSVWSRFPAASAYRKPHEWEHIQLRRQGLVRPLRLEFPGAVYHVTSRGDVGLVAR